ncbi:unnamed protein product [Prunus armeniaca]|uniref:Uncharacterized protein n=1 Tax=Prunus armeniaca TaxID=36596 RepID=A0A6J5X314_PRUAR|nr:unnamed protein product [Prunus armeniaca]
MEQSKYHNVEISSLEEVNEAREAFGDDKPIRFQVLRSVLAETYLAIVENFEGENSSSGRSDFIRYPRNPPYDPPPVVITQNFEEFKDALKTHGTYMEINVPVDVHPYVRQRVFLWADDIEVEVNNRDEI